MKPYFSLLHLLTAVALVAAGLAWWLWCINTQAFMAGFNGVVEQRLSYDQDDPVQVAIHDHNGSYDLGDISRVGVRFLVLVAILAGTIWWVMSVYKFMTTKQNEHVP